MGGEKRPRQTAEEFRRNKRETRRRLDYLEKRMCEDDRIALRDAIAAADVQRAEDNRAGEEKYNKAVADARAVFAAAQAKVTSRLRPHPTRAASICDLFGLGGG
jgi:hypothetical protein